MSPTLHIMKYLSAPLGVSPLNCTTESTVVNKNKAMQALTGNVLASLCHINAAKEHDSAVFSSSWNFRIWSLFCGAFSRPPTKKIYFTTDAHIHPQRSDDTIRCATWSLSSIRSLMYTFLPLYRSAHRQAAAHHSSRPVQSDARGG